VLALQPVFALQVTVPVTSRGFLDLLPFTAPFSPLIVAVNVTCCAYADGFGLEVTVMLEVAELMVKLPVCGLVEAL
jgi:hypothetical protein